MGFSFLKTEISKPWIKTTLQVFDFALLYNILNYISWQNFFVFLMMISVVD